MLRARALRPRREACSNDAEAKIAGADAVWAAVVVTVADEGGEDVVPNAGKTGVEAIVQLGKGDGVAGIAPEKSPLRSACS